MLIAPPPNHLNQNYRLFDDIKYTLAINKDQLLIKNSNRISEFK